MNAVDEHYLKQELYRQISLDPRVFDFLEEYVLDGLWYWDLEAPANEWCSPKFWHLLGYEPTEKKHLATEWQDLIYPEDLQLAIRNFEAHCQDPNYPYDQIVRYHHRNGSTVWVRCRGVAIRDNTGKPVRMLGAHHDLTRLKVAEATLKRYEELVKLHHDLQNANQKILAQSRQLQHMNQSLTHLANTDAGTGLNNRRAFEETFKKLLSMAMRHNFPLSLVLADLDHFKAINDQFGHLEGDRVLKNVAKLLQSTVRDSDFLARWGGEEFILLLPYSNAGDSHIMGERVRATIASHNWALTPVTCSIGLSTLTPGVQPSSFETTYDRLLREADTALYQAKQTGRNRVTHYTDLAK